MEQETIKQIARMQHQIDAHEEYARLILDDLVQKDTKLLKPEKDMGIYEKIFNVIYELKKHIPDEYWATVNFDE